MFERSRNSFTVSLPLTRHEGRLGGGLNSAKGMSGISFNECGSKLKCHILLLIGSGNPLILSLARYAS